MGSHEGESNSLVWEVRGEGWEVTVNVGQLIHVP
jgi:hypothetical protein